MTKKIALVTGVGPDNGSAIARRFSADGYRVAMLARNKERLATLEIELPGSRGYVCDVTDIDAVNHVLARVVSELGHPQVYVHNAVIGALTSYDKLELELFQQMFDVNVKALLYFAQKLAPAMIEAGQGAIIVTGNTAALRGGPNHAGFAPTKAAQRILSESLSRALGPQGIHVAYLIIDAVVDMPRMRARFPDKGNEFFIQPSAIADEVFHLAHQDKSAWSFLTELRPYGEKW